MSQSPSATRTALDLFTRSFRGRPRAAASAPGRVNLIGEHLDYNGGLVLPMAVARRTAVVVAAARNFEAVTARDGVVDRFDPSAMRGTWTDYLVGVLRAMERRDVRIPGAAIAVASAIPEGAGLSSSAALTVATTRALLGLVRERRPADWVAEVAWEAEHDEVGVRCGRMDQMISALAAPGKALYFDTATGTRRALAFPGKLWVVDTGVRHRLTDGGYNRRREECDEALRMLNAAGWKLPHLAAYPPSRLPAALAPHLARRVRHVATETARVQEAAELLAGSDPRATVRPSDRAQRLTALGALLTASHASLRDDFDASCEEADVLVEAAGKLGAWGARLTGAGWGGSVIVLAEESKAPRLILDLQAQFARIYGRTPAAWMTRAGSGVKTESVGG